MGPRYSNIGAAQALVRAGVKKLVVASPATISAYADGGVVEGRARRRASRRRCSRRMLPVTDANSTILKLVQAAGTGGGVILDFTPDTAPALLQAAVAQGLVDKVKWGSSTPIANTFMAGQTPAFDGKMYINSEFALLDSKGPDETLYNQINAKYTPKIAIQSFGQMGFMDAKFATQALLSIKGPITAKSYNNAVRALKDVKTDMLCKPWYVGNLEVPHPEQLGHHGRLQGRQGRPEGEVLRDRSGRPADRPDPRLGEEVPPERQLAKSSQLKR